MYDGMLDMQWGRTAELHAKLNLKLKELQELPEQKLDKKQPDQNSIVPESLS